MAVAQVLDCYFACDVDALIEQSLVRIETTGRKGSLGTGFVVAPRRVVTCFHVVQNQDRLTASGSIGQANVERYIRVEGTSTEGEPDIAILELDGDVAPPLPVAAVDIPSSTPLVGRGYGLPGTGYLASHPFKLTVLGRAGVQYRNDKVPLIDAIDMTGDGVGPGTSGAPLVDASSRAGVAMVVGGNPKPQVGRAWAVTLDAASVNAAFRQLLEWNDRELPRLGSAINARAARALFALGGRGSIDALVRERRFEPAVNVPREEASALLARFMESSKAVLAIVGPSNVGKSWLLASFASALLEQDEPANVLMFEARAIVRDSLSLEALVREGLAQAMSRTYPNAAGAGGPDRAAAVLSSAGVRMTFVIDALNEAPDWEWLGSTWLPQAVYWCDTHGAQLIVSCRSETWPIVGDLANLDQSLFFLPEGVEQSDPPAEWCFALSDFSDDEAALAARRYGLDPGRHSEVGPHPLMFRMARALADRERGVVAGGRFRLFDRYVDQQSGRALAQLGRGKGVTALQGIRASLRRLADALPPGGEGAIAITIAADMFRSEDEIHALIDEGILSSAKGYVRFRHDQLADVLRTPQVLAPDDLLRMMTGPGASILDREHVATSAASAVLRFDADGNESAYRSSIAAFIAATAASGERELLEQAERIARSLPARRCEDIESIYRTICEQSEDWVGAARALAEAPLPVEARVHLLLDRTVRTFSSRDGYPLRWKDWAVPSRRHAFIPSWGDRDEKKHLHSLLLAHREAVRHVLIERLGDTTNIGGEASVASLAAGLLFIDAETDYESLVRSVMAKRQLQAARDLLYEVFEVDRETASRLILESASAGPLDEQTTALLTFADRKLHSEATHAAVLRAYRALPRTDAPTAIAITLAYRIWDFDRSDPTVWDVATAVWSPYSSAPEIPRARLEEATKRIAARGAAYARYLLAWDRSDEVQQRRFVDALRTNLERSGDRYQLGMLLEDRLDALEGADGQRPWLELASEIVRARAEPDIEALEFGAFHSNVRRAWADELLEVFLRDVRSVEEASRFARRLSQSDAVPSKWSGWIALLRARYTDEVDSELWVGLAESCRMERYTDRQIALAMELVCLWRAGLPQSPTSRRVLTDLDVGFPLEELLTRDD